MRGSKIAVAAGLMLVLPLLGGISAEAAPKRPKPQPSSTTAEVPPTASSVPMASVDPEVDATEPEQQEVTTAATDECGTVLEKTDGTTWDCTFVDEFDGSALDRSMWHVQTNTPTGTTTARSCHVDDPANVAVSGGSLRLTVRKVAKPVQCAGKPAGYTSGQVSTFWKWSQQYGKFEARMKVSAATAPGLQEAFWLWPDARVPTWSYWPAAGEIDVVETYSYYPQLAIPFLHYTYNDNGGPWPGRNTAWDCAAQRGVWNTYTLEWTADRLEILVNGDSCLVNTTGDPAFDKAYIMAFTQALGVTGNGYTGATPLPATTEVDYIKVWK